MQHKTLCLALLSVTPIFAAPAPALRGNALNVPPPPPNVADATAIKARASVSDDSNISSAPLAFYLGYANVADPAVASNSAPAGSAPESFVKRQRSAESLSPPEDIKTSSAPLAFYLGYNANVADATAASDSAPPPPPDSFVKRQESAATALATGTEDATISAKWDPYCRPDGTNCVLLNVNALGDAPVATAVKRQNFAALLGADSDASADATAI